MAPICSLLMFNHDHGIYRKNPKSCIFLWAFHQVLSCPPRFDHNMGTVGTATAVQTMIGASFGAAVATLGGRTVENALEESWEFEQRVYVTGMGAAGGAAGVLVSKDIIREIHETQNESRSKQGNP